MSFSTSFMNEEHAPYLGSAAEARIATPVARGCVGGRAAALHVDDLGC